MSPWRLSESISLLLNFPSFLRVNVFLAVVQVLIRLGPGEMFGEISFLDAGDVGAAASVRAETEVTCEGYMHH